MTATADLQTKRYRQCQFEVKSVGSQEDGDSPVPFSGECSVFYNVDSAIEIVDDGAFDDTIPRFLTKGFITHEHRWDRPIGKPLKAAPAATGLAIDGEVYPRMFDGGSVAEGMRRGVYQEMSIGYYVEDYEHLSYEATVKYWASKGYAPSIQDHQRAANGVTLLKKIRLEEAAICIRGCNSRARVTGVKSVFRKLLDRIFGSSLKSSGQQETAAMIDEKAIDELVESLVSACRTAIKAAITEQTGAPANAPDPKVPDIQATESEGDPDGDVETAAAMARLNELDTEDEDI